MASKEIVAWDVSRHPDMDQQKRLLAMLAERLPLARSRSCTATWDGSTSTNGGGTSSDASASASFFSRIFHRFMGVTPITYRTTHTKRKSEE